MDVFPKMSAEKSKKYKQKFRNKWLENELFCDWLAAVEGDPYSAHCKACDCFLKAKLADLVMHRKSKKHNIHIADFKASLHNYKKVRHSSPDYIRAVDDNADMNDDCSSPLYLESDSEGFDYVRIQKKSDDDNSKYLSSGYRRHQVKHRSSDFMAKKHFRKSSPHGDPEFNEIYPKLETVTYDDISEDELSAFGRSIVAQMRKLPEERSVRLTAEIQSLVMRARIEYLEEKKTKGNSSQNTPGVTFSYKVVDTTSTTQSDQISTASSYSQL